MSAKAQEVAIRSDAVVINADAASLMAVITRAASDTSVDVDKLDRLLAMYERIKANEARAAFAAAFVACKAELQPVARNAKNEHTKSDYADMAAISNACDPIIVKHGFAPSYGTDQATLAGHYGVTCRLWHQGGHSEPYRADIPTDLAGPKGVTNKNATQAFGSTMTYGRRYLKLGIFDIVVRSKDDDDGNAASGNGGARITAEQATFIVDKVRDIGIPLDQFLNYVGAQTIAEITVAQHKRALHALGASKAAHAHRAKAVPPPPEDMSDMPDMPANLRRSPPPITGQPAPTVIPNARQRR